MSLSDIAKRSGLSKSTVSNISARDKFDGIPIDTVSAYSMACGVNHLKLERQLDFIRRRPMAHLKRGTRSQQKTFLRLMAA